MLVKTTSRGIRVDSHEKKLGKNKADWCSFLDLLVPARTGLAEMIGARVTVSFFRLILELLNNLLFRYTCGRRSAKYTESFAEARNVEIVLSVFASVATSVFESVGWYPLELENCKASLSLKSEDSP